MPAGVTVPLIFEIYKGGQLVRKETLNQDIVKIGKLSSSHLRLEDENVSRMHAVIEVTGPQEIFVVDLGSTKGTIVNGQKITSRCRLKTGDELLLGDTRIVVTVGEAQTASEAPKAAAPAPLRSTVMGMKSVGAVPPPTGEAGPTIPRAAAKPAAPPPPTYAPRQLPQGLIDQVEVQGTRAIEVVAMFGTGEDKPPAIVDTYHFTDAHAGEAKKSTVALLAASAVGFVGALVVFIVSFVQVAHLKALKEAFERANPNQQYQMPREGPLLDILIVILLAVGGVTLIMGLLRRFEEHKPRHFTIGPDPLALFNVPGDQVPAGVFPLVHSTGQGFELCFTDRMKGDLTVDGKHVALSELVASGRARSSDVAAGAHQLTMPEGGRAKIDLGESTFLVSAVAAPRYYPVPLNIDWGSHLYTGAVFLVWSLFLGMIFSIPPDPKSLSLDAFMNDQRFAKFLIKPPEEKEEQIPEWLKKKGPDDAGGKGKRHKGEEGKMGKKTSKQKTGLYALKGPKDNPDPHLAKMLAEEQAKQAGVLGILKAQDGSHLASIFGRDSALGTDAENVLGGLVGTQIGEAYGVGGLGLVGSGRGGGGTGEGTIGLGNLGTIGKGGGGGSGSGSGRGAGGLGGRRAHAPDVVPGTAAVRGALDKEIIRRIIRRHINEVKFCYEKDLASKPDLFGRVIIQFTISGSGQVVASVVQQSTMNSPSTEQCIAAAVRRWEFPKPQGGGIVIVSYPFVLKAAGGEGGGEE